MKQMIFQVDAFASTPFAGNPAAVCILEEPPDEHWMQSVAQEMNLADTAFLYQLTEVYNLRWFTPSVEVDLCGHATLASAHVLWEEGLLKPNDKAKFQTRSGELSAVRRDGWIELDLPTEAEATADPPVGLIEALGVNQKYVGKNRFDYLVEVESEEVLRSMAPDFKLLKTVPARGVIVTSRSEASEFDFVSRFFGPRSGVDEDPVTGSAHCCLGPYWGERLRKKSLVAYQASARGGVVRVQLGEGRVYIGGQAVTVLHGELNC